jgi:hypothetical protein
MLPKTAWVITRPFLNVATHLFGKVHPSFERLYGKMTTDLTTKIADLSSRACAGE